MPRRGVPLKEYRMHSPHSEKHYNEASLHKHNRLLFCSTNSEYTSRKKKESGKPTSIATAQVYPTHEARGTYVSLWLS